MANSNLTNAKNAKVDEFYTQYHDIEQEIAAYLEYNPDVFRGKTILLPCDDPEWSNFTKFFAQNFERFGLKKLISTSYAPDSKNYKGAYQPTLFETNDPQFDKQKTIVNGKLFTLSKDISGDGKIDVNDLEWNYLKGDGDFRSNEIKKLRDEADFIVTNPPFSLFREFWTWITIAQKQFVIIGNMNAITYKEIFPFIKENHAWLGATNFNTGMYFRVPPDFVYADSYKFEREKNGEKVNRVPGVCWFTNIDHGRRHQPLPLMSMTDNLKFSKHKEIKGKASYDHYDNYEGIDVPFTDAIPSDYDGVMGVPITFLDKYCPEQFEIMGTSDNGIIDDEFKKTQGLSQKFVDDYYKAGGKGAYKEGNPTAGLYNNGIATMAYKRIFIRHKKAKK
ncbi:MAG: adenine-specific methyltransferase EcoRI family protein [Bacteroidales bacterium]|jgi:hypothetical protein|nr:adenine-specific methyltransferase EcoRI family protein [Bacteroidales bacterium]